jgi:hypothetical protein
MCHLQVVTYIDYAVRQALIMNKDYVVSIPSIYMHWAKSVDYGMGTLTHKLI